VAKIRHFAKNKKFLETWLMELFGTFPKKSANLKGLFIRKLPRFLEDLGRFLAFLLLKSPNLLNKL
jgi:hypothetical protein